MRRLLLGLCMVAATAVRATAAPAPLHNGDLVFQESTSSQSSAILAATGSTITHMGVIVVDEGVLEPFVVEASARVRKIPLGQWLKQGKGRRYAMYRPKDLSAADGLRVKEAVLGYLGRPYDIFFRFGDDHIYCSEWAVLAFRKIGIELGHVQTIETLNASAPQVRRLFAKRWKQHPDCRRAGSANDCWQIVLHQPLVTPASIANDKRLTMLVSWPPDFVQGMRP